MRAICFIMSKLSVHTEPKRHTKSEIMCTKICRTTAELTSKWIIKSREAFLALSNMYTSSCISSIAETTTRGSEDEVNFLVVDAKRLGKEKHSALRRCHKKYKVITWRRTMMMNKCRCHLSSCCLLLSARGRLFQSNTEKMSAQIFGVDSATTHLRRLFLTN